MIKTDDFEIGKNIKGRGLTAARAVVKFLKAEQVALDGGGCRAFFSADEWAKRGERFGTKSVLVLVHDGGVLSTYCDLDSGAHHAQERFTAWLAEEGLYVEACTGWYSAIYEAG